MAASRLPIFRADTKVIEVIIIGNKRILVHAAPSFSDYNYYYPRSWGGMYKNAFITYDNNLYYLGSDSKMAIGWQSIGGNTYYFRNWGGMITGKQVIDGKTYVFDEDGKLVQIRNGIRTVRADR